jgi:hypothetical protein
MLPPRPPSQGCVGSASLRRRAFVKSAPEQDGKTPAKDLDKGRAATSSNEPNTQVPARAVKDVSANRRAGKAQKEDEDCTNDSESDSDSEPAACIDTLQEQQSKNAPSTPIQSQALRPATTKGREPAFCAHRPPSLTYSPGALSADDSEDGEPLSPFREDEGFISIVAAQAPQPKRESHHGAPASAGTDSRPQAMAMLMQRQVEVAARVRAVAASGAERAGECDPEEDTESGRRRERLRERVRAVLSDEDKVANAQPSAAARLPRALSETFLAGTVQLSALPRRGFVDVSHMDTPTARARRDPSLLPAHLTAPSRLSPAQYALLRPSPLSTSRPCPLSRPLHGRSAASSSSITAAPPRSAAALPRAAPHRAAPHVIPRCISRRRCCCSRRSPCAAAAAAPAPAAAPPSSSRPPPPLAPLLLSSLSDARSGVMRASRRPLGKAG